MKQFDSDIRYVEATPRRKRRQKGSYSSSVVSGATSSGDNAALRSYVDATFVSLLLGQEITADHNFLNGFSISGIPFRKMANGSLFIDANVVFGGGVTMYGTDSTPAPSIFDGLPIDGRTIKRDGNGALYVDETALSISGGGGVADSVAWANVTGKPTWITNTKPTYNYSEILNTPDLSNYATKSWVNVELSNYVPSRGFVKADSYRGNWMGYTHTDAGYGGKYAGGVISAGLDASGFQLNANNYGTRIALRSNNSGTWTDWAVIAMLTDIPSLDGYATQSWVEDQQYLTEITSGMIESVLGYQPYDGDTNRLGFLTSSALTPYFLDSNFTKANIKSTLGISDWALESAKPTYNYSEIQGTPDLRVYALASSLDNYALKSSIPTDNNQLINGAGYITQSALTDYAMQSWVNTELLKYLPIAGGTINGSLGVVNQLTAGSIVSNGNTISIGGGKLYYNSSLQTWQLDGSLLVTGGISMYSTFENFTPSDIFQGLPIDNETIYWDKGVLKAMGGGGVADSVAWVNVVGKPTWITANKPQYTYSEILNTPDLSIYLTKSGGTANGAITAPTFIGALQGNASSATTTSNFSGLGYDYFIKSPSSYTFTSFNSGLARNAIYEYQAGDGVSYGGDPVGSGYGALMNIRDYRGYDGFQILVTAATAWNKDDYRFLFRGKARSTSLDMSNGWREVPLMDMSGNLTIKGALLQSSQRSLKNVLSYDGLSLEQLSVIKPIKFTWKDSRDNRFHVGGIADDVQSVIPEVVYSTNDFLTMDYGNAGFYVAASLIKPVIDHEQRIQQLEQENKSLRDEINQLKQML